MWDVEGGAVFTLFTVTGILVFSCQGVENGWRVSDSKGIVVENGKARGSVPSVVWPALMPDRDVRSWCDVEVCQNISPDLGLALWLD